LLLGILAVGLVDQLWYSFQLNFGLNLLGWGITGLPFVAAFVGWSRVEAEFVMEEVTLASVFGEKPKQIEMY
jgi:hypothetical protein